MQPQQQDWTIRDGVPEDENAIVSTWLKSFAHSKYGVRRGAHIDRSSEEQDYWKEHRAIVTGLVRGETVRVACDPERAKHKPDAPAIIWAWCCTSGDDLLHYVLVKRSAIKAGLGPERLHALIGDRLKRRQWITFEQVELSTAPGRSGVPTPDEWRRADPLWIPRRQYAWAKAAAA